MNKLKKTLSLLVVSLMVFNGVTPSGLAKINTTNVSAAVTTQSSNGNTFTLTDDTLNIKTATDTIDLQVCTSNIMKVNYKPGGAEDPETLVIDPNLKWSTGNIVSSDLTSDPMVLKTDSMTIKISKSDLSVSVYNASNNLLIKQTSITTAKSVSFTHNSGENFYGVSGYGCGTSANDGSLRNNNSYDVTSAGQGWAGGPFIWSTGGYGLLVDSDGGKMTTSDTGLSYTGISKKNSEYFVIVGKPEDVMKGLSKISGSSPMYPKWAMGFTNTQWGWAGAGTVEDQVKSVIQTYRSKNIPIDNFCFDFDWKNWGTLSDYGEFTWNATNFPSAASGNLKKWTAANGIHFTGIVKPRIFTGKENGTDTAEYAAAKAGGFVLSGASGSDYCSSKDYVSVDFSTQAARSWWWKSTQNAFDLGLSGYWNDEIDHENGYGNFGDFNVQRAQYEGQRAYTNGSTRVWSINRNFYLGAQRYAYGVWTGDISTGFTNMKGQAGKLIAAANLGETKWGMDTGGFNGGDPTPENYARWIEFSAFTPIFRVHGQDCRTAAQAPNTGRGTTPRYPWNFGTTAEAASKKVMQLRYQLIPYIYKYEHDASQGGTGIVKPLMMEYPNDKNVQGEVYSWMFGDNLLVSPVLDQGITSKSIYLPAGTWIDYFTGKTYAGGQTIDYAVNSTSWDDVPLFVKQGAIIPSQDYENYVGEKKMTNIYVDVFPDSKASSFDYYDDDSNSYSYETGNYFKQKLSVTKNSTKDGVVFSTAAKEGTYTPDVQNYIVKMHVKSPSGTVTIGGQTPTKYASLDALKSATGEGYAVGTDTYGDVVYVKIAAGQLKDVNVKCSLPVAPTQKATVYAKTSSSSSTLQYSVDNGVTWSAGQSMVQSDKIGYSQTNFSYSLSDADAVKVRLTDGTSYKPSSDGVTLSSDGDVFTIAKDGTVSTGTPAMSTSTVYIQTSKAASPVIQYQDASGNWSSSLSMDAWPGDSTKTEYSKSLSYATEDSAPVIRYSEDGGTTWEPSASGQAIGEGDYMNDSTGAITAGKPSWKQLIIVHFKAPTGWAAPNIYAYSSDANKTQFTGAWPGTKMTSEGNGWYSYTIDKGATSAKVIFDDGKNQMPGASQPGMDVSAGESWYDGTTWSKVNPNAPKLSVDIAGGSYQSAQKITLTATNNASIYYTLDGTTPSASSTKYTGPITIDSTKALEAIAIDANGNKSSVDIECYTIGSNTSGNTGGNTGGSTGGSTTTPGGNTGGSTTTYETLKSVTASSNNTSVKVGDKITFTANVNTTDPTVQYAFGYFDSNNNWKVLSNFSSSKTFEWTTNSVGSYQVIAMAKSSTTGQINSSPLIVTVSSASSQTGTGTNTFDNNKVSNVLAVMVLSSIAVAFAIKRKRAA